MKIILLQDVENLGTEGEIVTVKDGYGRNFLIPRGQALMATKGAVKARHEEMRQQVRKRAQEKENAQELLKQLEKTEVVVQAKVGEENRIFGTITTQQVALKLAAQGFQIDRRHVSLSEDIRVIGVYTAQVKLHSDVVAQVKVRVEPEGGVVEEAPPAETEAEAAPAAEAKAAPAADEAEAAPAAEAKAAPAADEAEAAADAPQARDAAEG